MFKTVRFIPVIALALAASSFIAAPATSATAPTEVRLFYVSDTPLGLKLFTERRMLQTGGDAALAAVTALITNSPAPADPDYSNLWGVKTNKVISLTRDGAQAVLDLDYGGLNVGSAGEMAAIMQVMWTVTTADPTIKELKFTNKGADMETLAGHVEASNYFTRGRHYESLSAVTISKPFADSTVYSPVQVRGMACTFEANVAWQLWRDHKRIRSGSVLADGACPVRGHWSLTLKNLKPGIYVLKAMEYSAKDGSLAAIDSKSFIVK